MSPRRKSTAPGDEVYAYTWTGEYRVIIDGHTTPAGSAAEVFPGKPFEVTTPIDQVSCPLAVPANDAAKAAAEAQAPTADESESDAGGDEDATTEHAEDASATDPATPEA